MSFKSICFFLTAKGKHKGENSLKITVISSAAEKSIYIDLSTPLYSGDHVPNNDDTAGRFSVFSVHPWQFKLQKVILFRLVRHEPINQLTRKP
ncbi:hypothetical protein DRW42_25130 [Pedobacter miscanthi]|uniref:Uncharacterized protein n=1 Tax=Pedobacter miscanthi TaxID=2259170 RepID=A0A366KPK7_9SPHI|nr:hypothetical protein DRW42_25130 [Pedobacter miscanthi]